ncbi:ATP-binding cassette domain-containing protein [Gelidibacter salicanalis]|uniref:ATP-binding cassette domain-containing protein n=2 Tax=Gelidibacter salicanalis TaxID=291193 RepID=A0A934NHZ2_9FLAO|nr:ATP-binding cassette domain-containing protein [Gelidibacter salicanalis]
MLLSNTVNKIVFINTILSGKSNGGLSVFNDCKGVLFSDLTIAQFIEKEHRYDSIEISKSENRQLHTFSSGERRKVLLEYCLAQTPDYIILDNPFDHLDQQSRIDLSNQLVELSNSISIIQLANREENLLPFINRKGYVYDNSFDIFDIPNPFQTQQSNVAPIFPSSLLSYNKVYEKIIKFDQVRIDYDDQPIITDITWEVKHGEFWQLIGPNGSGKSTILSLINGENPKAYGQNITIFDKKKGSGESIWNLKKKIGHFSTHLAELFKKNHTVEQMVLSGFFDSVGLYVKPSGLQQEKAIQWLEVINIRHLKNVYFNRLPLGQQRLVLIIRALIKQPPLLILDEPFEGLDQENTNLVAQLLNTLIERTEITVIYVSHTIEKSLVPSHIYELTPTKNGSIGRIKS